MFSQLMAICSFSKLCVAQVGNMCPRKRIMFLTAQYLVLLSIFLSDGTQNAETNLPQPTIRQDGLRRPALTTETTENSSVSVNPELIPIRRGQRSVTDFSNLTPNMQRGVQIHSSLPPETPIAAGTTIRFRCATALEGRSPYTMNLLRQRADQSEPHLIDQMTLDQPFKRQPWEKEFRLLLHEDDNGAAFLCEVSSSYASTPVFRSDRLRFNITFPPKGVHVVGLPSGPVSESVKKTFVCQLNEPGSNPPSELDWTQLDAAGAQLSMADVHIAPTEQLQGPSGTMVARSNLTVIARRALNGRRFECTAIYQQKKTVLRSEEMLEVKFSPNNVRLIAQPLDGVQETHPLELTCQTSSCHPPALIRWFEILPAQAGKDRPPSNQPTSAKHEVTDLAQLDTSPGEFGGTQISSKLTVANTYRTNQNTVYQCQVDHPAMHIPIVNNHKLQVLYPPSVTIVSLPSEPVVGQTVTLSCQTSGGHPQFGFTHSWYSATIGSTLGHAQSSDAGHTESQKRDNPTGGPSRTSPARPDLKQMVRLTRSQDSQLNISAVKLAHRGWYACEAAGEGGEAHAFHFLDVLYLPIVDPRTESRVVARLGETVSLILYLDANPPLAEATWFQLGSSSASTGSAGPSSNEALVDPWGHAGSDMYDDDPFGTSRHRSRKSLTGKSARRLVGVENSERHHIVAERGHDGIESNLTFSLNLYGVRQEDFGDYVCQVQHRLGMKEFYFQLIQGSDNGGILPDSVTLIQHGTATVVRFRPVRTPLYTRLVLRVCRRDALQQTRVPRRSKADSHNADPSRFQQQQQQPNPEAVDDRNAARAHASPTKTDGCAEYQVAKPSSGQTEVHLTEAVQLYNFRLLLYRGTELIQETQPFLWQPDISNHGNSLSATLIALAVTGAIVFITILSITVGLAYVYRNRTRKTDALYMSNMIKSPDPAISTTDSQYGLSSRTQTNRLQPGFELTSDLGSIRSYQPSDVEGIPLLNQSGNAVSTVYDPTAISDNCSSQLRLISSDHGNCTPTMVNNNAPVAMLSNRLVAEAYLAASRAASAAVAASSLAGSASLYTPSTHQHMPHDQPMDQATSTEASSTTANARNSTDSQNGQNVQSTKPDQTRQVGSGANTEGTQRGQDRLKVDMFPSSGTRGSRLSVQSATPNASSHWSSMSGTSYTSLNSSSQLSLEVAARAAAVAAVASVMQNVNLNWMLQQAASSAQMLPYMNSSRPASVAGQNVVTASSESGDADSLHSTATGRRRCAPHPCSTPGEITPTASLNTFDQAHYPANGSHLVVPVPHRYPSAQRLHPMNAHEYHHWRYGQADRTMMWPGMQQPRQTNVGRVDPFYVQRAMPRAPIPREMMNPRTMTHRAPNPNGYGLRQAPPPPVYFPPMAQYHPVDNSVRMQSGFGQPLAQYRWPSMEIRYQQPPSSAVPNVSDQGSGPDTTQTTDNMTAKEQPGSTGIAPDEAINANNLGTHETAEACVEPVPAQPCEQNGPTDEESDTLTSKVDYSQIVTVPQLGSNRKPKPKTPTTEPVSSPSRPTAQAPNNEPDIANQQPDRNHSLPTSASTNDGEQCKPRLEANAYKPQPRLGINSTGRTAKKGPYAYTEPGDDTGKRTMEVKPLLIPTVQEPCETQAELTVKQNEME